MGNREKLRGKANRTKRPKECRASIAMKALLELDLQFYCNVVGTPCIRLPPARAGPQQEEWPLYSGRVRAWIAEFAWDKLGIVLLEQEITRILTVLEGKSWHDQRLDLEVKDAMEQDPLVEAIVIWTNQNPTFENTQTKLLGELLKIANKYGVDTQTKAWPKGPAQLSRRIRDLVPLLRKAGVIAVIGRKPGGERFIDLKRTTTNQAIPEGSDDDDQTPSHVASVDKSHHPRQMRQIDGGDGDVFDRLKKEPVPEMKGPTNAGH